ncbi:MAG: hypothetical protein HGB36_00915 [Chlorobiaceae bacterium]|jgi:hypothetical protein|nr:hypothetical protein [Chlorobiaceae bacterium]
MNDVHLIFIHGLANKPAQNELRRIWLNALRSPVIGDDGFDLGVAGVSDSFVYWADLFYNAPISAAQYESISDEVSESLKGPSSSIPSDEWIIAMRKLYPEAGELYPDPPVAPELPGYERIPLPGFIKKAIMAEYLREAHDYLFNVNGVRDTIRSRVLDSLYGYPNATRRILVSHSQGTFIAYDVMTALAECPRIDGFVTFGSPLGIDEVQDHLVWSRDNGFPAKLKGDWINVFDPFDLVARPDPCLANDFRKEGVSVVLDVQEENWGTWRHSATKYLKGPKLRAQLRRMCGREGG